MPPIQYKPGYNTSWALLVGINDYMYASPLSYACNDVDALHDSLINLFGFPAQNVFCLKNAQAKKQDILDQFIRFHKLANNPDDRILFFFAGHGYTTEGNKGPVGYLVPTDGDSNNLNSLIRWDELTKNSDLIGAKHILFLIDACYSGLAFKRSVPPGVQRFLTDLLQRTARQVLTAGKADQVVADGGGPQGKNSIFTGYLMEGLQGKACNTEGILTASYLMKYVYENVGQNSLSEQTPHYGHIEGDGDFIFLSPDLAHINQGISTDYNLEMVDEETGWEEASTIASSQKSFARQRGYFSEEHPNFGRNDLTGKLGESRSREDSSGIEKAFSWLGIVIEPLANQITQIDIVKKGGDGKKLYIPGEHPYEQFSLPLSKRTTANSIFFFSDQYYRPYWERFLKIDSAGKIEYGDSSNVFMEWKEYRLFKFVQIIGLTWQLLFLAKTLFLETGYTSSVRLTIGLVGTMDTILSDFSTEKGLNEKFWVEPLIHPLGFLRNNERQKCMDRNIKSEQEFTIGKIGYEESLLIIKNIAQKIDLAYNHSNPIRCFNYNSDNFPWNQYLQGQRY